MSGMNKRLQMAVRRPACEACSLGQKPLDPDDRCVTGSGPNNAKWMIVTNYPVEPNSHLYRLIVEQFREAGLDATAAMWCSAVKCRVWDLNPTRTDLKTCKPYLLQEIDHVQPKYIITLGNEALYPFTGVNSGVTKYKGLTSDYNGATVFHTLSPASVLKQPSQLPSYMSDLLYFYRMMNEVTNHEQYHKPTQDRVLTVDTTNLVRSMAKEIRQSKLIAFDIESTHLDEHNSGAAIVSLAVTSTRSDMSDAFVWQLPLYHPESPFEKNWRKVLRYLGPSLKTPPKRVAHNGKHDCRWLHQFGIPDITHTFDTILGLSVLNENRVKGLKPACQEILGAEPWGIDVTNLLDTPLEDVLQYNGLDTWHDLRLYFYLREQLLLHPKQGNLFAKLLMPAMKEFISIESHGIYVDKQKLKKNSATIRNNLLRAEEELDTHIPQQIPDKFIAKRSGERKINWNASDFSRWFLFDHLQLPVLKRGKRKPNGAPGAPSMDKSVMMVLKQQHPVPGMMLERSKWNQLETTFITPYEEIVDEQSRIRTVFKPWAVVTGRVSSGKEDAEKITGGLSGRAVNLMQVPQERLVRSVFGAPPGWLWVGADQSQIELRIAAFLAQEPTMLHLYQTGQDIHTAAAMQMTGKPANQITKDERQKAKARNFGFLFGMGWQKFIVQAFIDYGISFTEQEAKANRDSFFTQFSRLQGWHWKQKWLARKYGRVQTPMGRVRHLPDIYSPDEAVRAEAERQAINSPVQAMASDLAMLSMININRRFRREKLKAHTVGFVHDEVNFEIHEDDIMKAIPIIQQEMENPPLRKLFGIELNVPLKADIEVGFHWGECVELPEDIGEQMTTIDILLKERAV